MVTEYPQSRYSIEGNIGEGSYGKVDKALDLKTCKTVAIKTMKETSNDSVPHFVLRELDVLRQLSGQPGIVPLLAVYREKDQKTKGNLIKFVFPFCEIGDLQAFMRQRNKHAQAGDHLGLPVEQVIDFAEQILRALQIIHNK